MSSMAKPLSFLRHLSGWPLAVPESQYTFKMKSALNSKSLVASLSLFLSLYTMSSVVQQSAVAAPPVLTVGPPMSSSGDASPAIAQQLEQQLVGALSQMAPAIGYMVISMLEMASAEALLPLSICPQTVLFHNLVSSQVQDSMTRIETELNKIPQTMGQAMPGSLDSTAMQKELNGFRLKIREQMQSRKMQTMARLGDRLPQVCEKASKDSAEDAAFLLKHKDTVLSFAQSTDWTKEPSESQIPAVLKGGANSPFSLSAKRYLEVYSDALGLQESIPEPHN